jgi:ligand-binding sensor domain-containing protein/signal transduction histidine kinase
MEWSRTRSTLRKPGLCQRCVASFLMALASVAVARPASAERLPITPYTTADGLAHVRVTCIVADSRGFVWFCSPAGLSRFDGQGFTTYATAQGLANTRINHFLETSHGTYWIATNGGGVYRFNPLTSGPLAQRTVVPNQVRAGAADAVRFTAFRVGDDLQTNRVNVLREDRAGRLWAGTDGGLFCLDAEGDSKSFRRVELRLPDRPDLALQIWALAEDREGTLWIGTSWGLLRRFTDGRVLHSAVEPTQGIDQVRAVLIDRAGTVWVGHDTGLVVLRPGPERMGAKRYGVRDGVSEGAVRALLQSTDGRIWIGTLNGLTEFDGERFRPFSKSDGVTRTTALAEDREGNLWLGTMATGALRLAPNGFSAYTEEDGLADASIGDVFESRDGNLYAVSTNQRIHRFDGRRFTATRPNLSRDATETNGPGKVIQDRTGEWWIPGGAGLYRFPSVSRVEQLQHARPQAIYTTRDGLAGDDVFRLFEDSRGDIWIGRRTPTAFVVTRWERATGAFHRYSDADGLPAFNRISSFAEDDAGNVWMGFWSGGLARYHDGRFEMFTDAAGAPHRAISHLHVDAAGRLWIGSSQPALTLVETPAAERPRFIGYTKALPSFGESVGCITEDALGRLYLCLPSGRVARLDPATGRVWHYSTADGLPGPDLNAAFRDRHGGVWFGSYNGLFRLVPGLDRSLSAPAVLIGGLRVAGENYLTSDLGESHIPRFELQANRNQLHFDFFGLGGSSGNRVRYQYRLEGADRDWNDPAEQREVNYASLSPGMYRFVVRAVGSDGALSPTPATVEFIILRPIWQRWWFQSSAALGLIVVVFAAHRHRVARLVALERVRMRIAADLHDDIGGSLSRISIQSEVARREATASGESPVRRLEEIAESARGLVDALADVVWSVDPRRDDLASVVRRVREYADDVLPGSGVRWTYSVPPDLDHVKLDPQARRHLFLLLKEAITNVVRHAGAGSASLAIAVAPRELRVDLRDDGCGFFPDAPSGATVSDRHGLRSMRTRAAGLGASISIESSPTTGTCVSLRMPLRGGRMTMLLPRWLR